MHVTDVQLVGQSLSGDREAYGEIVSRYKTLICSVAYGATGNLQASEELAHDAFVAGWQSLKSLDDPGKLRAWLCGIVRNLARNRSRSRARDLLSNAEDIEHSASRTGLESDPVDSTIAREEAELLNRTLASLPENYREPLILYYREQQSVSRVAELLDISSDAVKQRLSRGREMLRKEVAATVERGLSISAPTAAFTFGVVAALPVMSGTAKAAVATATTAKSVGAMQAAGLTGLSGAILGPLAGILGGWFGYSVTMKSARSDEERAFVRKSTGWMIALIVLFGVGLAGITLPLRLSPTILAWTQQNPTAYIAIVLAVVIGYVVGLVMLIRWTNQGIARIRRETNTEDVDLNELQRNVPAPFKQLQQPRRYDSPQRFAGLPLLSVRLGTGKAEKAVGWIAIGDGWAYGLLFASGTYAVGTVAFGAFGFGLLAMGGFAAGVLALGGAGVGAWVCGGVGFGWSVFCGIALGWHMAVGGIAIAKHYALGGIVSGLHENTDAAKAILENSAFFRRAGLLMTPWGWWALVAAGLAPLYLVTKYLPPTDVAEANAEES